MSLSDSLRYTRHRKRLLDNTSGVPYVSHLFDSVTAQGVSQKLLSYEETWDRKNDWPDWQRHLDYLRHADHYGSASTSKEVRAYLRELRMTDVGGPFYNKKEQIVMDPRVYDAWYSNGTYKRYRGYRGPLAASVITNTALRSGPFASAYNASDEAYLDAFGTTAISRCSPTNPHAQLLTAIGEIYRDGLPKIPGLQSLQGHNPSSVAGDYLNYEFGVVPALNDMKDLHKAAKNADYILKQYYRDSGRLVRRSYSSDTVKTTTSSKTGLGVAPTSLGAGLDGFTVDVSKCSIRTVITETIDRWFSGAFTYHAGDIHPSIGKLEGQIQEWNHLYGVIPTPEVIWNLTPWTWAADWMSNMGDIFNNASMFLTDGLVLKYGYVMEHKVREVEVTCGGFRLYQGSGWSDYMTTSQRFIQETKRRRAATPFGFGLELDGFTDRQWAILAALGISRRGMVAR